MNCIGDIIMIGCNYPPRGWAKCEGQLLPIYENDALYALLGTMYGGDGRTTFGLPDLRGRTPICVGQGPGLEPIKQGKKIGSPILLFPKGSAEKTTESGAMVYTPLDVETTTDDNYQPYLGTNFIIALVGVFPPRT